MKGPTPPASQEAPKTPQQGDKRHPLVPLVTPAKHAIKTPNGALGHRPSHVR